jgi:hypothetical protein
MMTSNFGKDADIQLQTIARLVIVAESGEHDGRGEINIQYDDSLQE